MNSSVFSGAAHSSRSNNRDNHNYSTVQSAGYEINQRDLMKEINISAIKSLKPTTKQSTYGNSFTSAQLVLNKPDSLLDAEEYLSQKKRIAKDTCLPGFSELKVSLDVMSSI